MRENYNLKAVWEDFSADFKKENLLKTIKKYLLILLGCLFLAIGDSFFLIPNSIVIGGASGIGIVIGKATGFNTEIIITILNWVFFVIGFLLLGFKFSFKTLLSTVFYPLFLLGFTHIYNSNEWFHVVSSTATDNTASLIIAGVFGGALAGLGCATTYLSGGSTGGTDAISLSIEKYFHVKASLATFAIDCIIISLGVFFMQNITLLLIGISASFACSLMIDKVYLGNNDCFYAQIISSHWEEINDVINEKMGRGTTLFDSYGGYTGKEKIMLQVAFSREEYDEIQKIVFSIDKKAFMTVTRAHDVTGDGFKKISPRIKREIIIENNNKKNKNSKKK